MNQIHNEVKFVNYTNETGLIDIEIDIEKYTEDQRHQYMSERLFDELENTY